MTSTSVFVTTSFVGFHCWPDAPEEVKFLRTVHRHEFGVIVTVNVTHSDRQVEFFILKKDVLKAIDRMGIDLQLDPRLSCEMMAEKIGNELSEVYAYNVRQVEVNEDGENGAIVEFLS